MGVQNDASNHHLNPIAKTWQKSGFKTPDLPALVSAAASDGDPLMKDALNLWLSAYGSVAGDLALQELCKGGLWIGGGTATKHLQGISSKPFLKAMKRKGRFEQFLEELPVMALIDEEASLFSAACRARLLVS